MNPNRNLRNLLAALAVLVASLALAACGSDDGDESGSQDVTTTVTTVEGEAAASGSAAETETAGNTANPEVSQATADSDAAGAIPGEQAAVAETDAADAQAATTTTTTTTEAGTTGEQTTATTESSGTTTTVDPATGQPAEATTTPVDPATGQPVQGTTTTTPIDPATGQPLTTTTTPTPTPTTSGTTTGVRPLIPASPVLAGTGAEAILSRPFNSASPWNTAVAGNPVDRRSERWIRLAEVRVATVEVGDGQAAARDVLSQGDVTSDGQVINESFTGLSGSRRERRRIDEGLTVNVTRWTVPVFSDRQEGAVERVAVCRQFNCGPDAVTTVTVPLDACPDPRYDGWMTVIDNTTRTALDFWRGRCEADGSLSYHYVKRWDLDGPGFQEPLEVSARGSGLPLFAGLITPEEIRDGQIDHALAISVPGAAQRRYVQPASRTDGTGVKSSIPEGARIRLRQGAIDDLGKTFVRNKMQRSTAATIIAALQRYGAIVVDRSAAPTLYAQKNADWTGILPLNLLQDIDLEQFDVVEAGPILLDPPAAGEETAVVLPEGTPGSIPGTASGSQGEFSSPSTGVAP